FARSKPRPCASCATPRGPASSRHFSPTCMNDDRICAPWRGFKSLQERQKVEFEVTKGPKGFAPRHPQTHPVCASLGLRKQSIQTESWIRVSLRAEGGKSGVKWARYTQSEWGQ